MWCKMPNHIENTVDTIIKRLEDLKNDAVLIDEIDSVAKEVSLAEVVVFVGVGKSLEIAKKSAATFRSLGCNAQTVHAVDFLHGDSGALCKKGLVVIVSHSGKTKELLPVIDFCQAGRIKTVMVSSKENKECWYNLVYPFSDEASNEGGIAFPSISTIFTSLLTDLIAIEYIKHANVTKELFSKHHPCGSLGNGK